MQRKPRLPDWSASLVAGLEKRPVLSLVAGILLFVLFALGLGRISPNFTHTGYFYPDDPLLTDLERMEARFGNDDAVVVAVHSADGIFDRDSLAVVSELTRKLWLVSDVVRVDSISNFNWTHAKGDELTVEPLIPEGELTDALIDERKRVALAHESLPGYLISRDANTALLFARIRSSLQGKPDAKRITSEVEALAAEQRKTGHELHVTGGPVIEAAYANAAEADNAAILPLVLGICALMLAVVLRHLVAVLVAFVIILLAVVVSLGATGWLGVELTSITAALPQIFVAVGAADAVHLLSTFLRERRQGTDRTEAARTSLNKNLLPTVVTSLTTGLGFASFCTSEIKAVAGFGLAAGVGVAAVWAISVLIIGGLLFLLPWNVKRAPEQRQVASTWPRTAAARLVSSRRGIWLAFGALAVASGVLALFNRVDADPVKYFAEQHPLRRATEFIESGVGAARSIEIVIDSGRVDGVKSPEFLRKVDQLDAWLETRPRVTQTVSIADMLKHVNRALNGGDDRHYALADNAETIGQELLLYNMNLPEGMDLADRVTVDADALRMTVLWTIGNSSEAIHEIELLEQKIEELGLSAVITGKYPLYQRLESHLVRSFLSSLGIALLLISGVMMLVFRSVWVGLFAMVPNIFPLLFGAGALFVLGENFTVGTVLVMSVTLGIAVDDTVYVMSEFIKQRRAGIAPEPAIANILRDTAPSLVCTSAVLVCTFGAFILSTFTPNQVFGALSAIVLAVALIADVILLPSLLMWRVPRRAVAVRAPAVAAEPAE